MAKHIRQIEKDGFVFNVHEVAIDGGKTKIGEVEIFAPQNLEQLADGVEKGLDTDEHACSLYRSASAVEAQAQMRAAKKGGKIPTAEYAKIFNAITAEQHAEFNKTSNPWQAINNYVNGIWRERQNA